MTVTFELNLYVGSFTFIDLLAKPRSQMSPLSAGIRYVHPVLSRRGFSIFTDSSVCINSCQLPVSHSRRWEKTRMNPCEIIKTSAEIGTPAQLPARATVYLRPLLHTMIYARINDATTLCMGTCVCTRFGVFFVPCENCIPDIYRDHPPPPHAHNAPPPPPPHNRV